MQYAVPQFIEIEDKVIGPLTTKQFLYLVVGGVFLLITWALADISLFILLAIITAVIIIPFAFIKMNGRPFEIYVKSVFKFYTTPKIRLWIRDYKKSLLKVSGAGKSGRKIAKAQTQKVGDKVFNRSKIQELSQILDMGGSVKENSEPK
ncbi:MAG: PrgI family protein [Parcubacteria group bacterium]|nr:PrgI family protein [Parcubacteria group bacterium]